MKATIWHNPRCSKSREALALLEAAGADVSIFDYLKAPLSPDELKRILAAAGVSPREAMRAGEVEAANLKDATDEEIVETMLLHPILIERPLVETEKGAVLARPPERVHDIL